MSKEKKPSKAKESLAKAFEAVKAVPNIWSNLEHLVEAICLVAVAGYAFYSSYQVDFAVDAAAYALRFASVVIALRGAIEFLKQMNKR